MNQSINQQINQSINQSISISFEAFMATEFNEMFSGRLRRQCLKVC